MVNTKKNSFGNIIWSSLVSVTSLILYNLPCSDVTTPLGVFNPHLPSPNLYPGGSLIEYVFILYLFAIFIYFGPN